MSSIKARQLEMGTKSISFQNWGVLRYGYCSLVLSTWICYPVFLWNTHSKDVIRELTMYKTRKDSQGQGWGTFLRRSFNCSPQMGNEGIHTVLPPANYIQAFSFPPMSTQWKEWICASRNNTSPFFIPSNLCQLQSTACRCLWTCN